MRDGSYPEYSVNLNDCNHVIPGHAINNISVLPRPWEFGEGGTEEKGRDVGVERVCVEVLFGLTSGT